MKKVSKELEAFLEIVKKAEENHIIDNWQIGKKGVHKND